MEVNAIVMDFEINNGRKISLEVWLSEVKAMSKQCKSESKENLNLKAWLSEVKAMKWETHWVKKKKREK